MREWERQQAVQLTKDPDPLDLAYSTFYMNRTNRSGIIMGGVIGGRDQTGKWKLDARFNRNDLIRRIQCIGRWRSRIEVSSLNGAVFLRTVVPRLPTRSLVYLDPPYYVKGKELLYANYYAPDDHEALSKLVGALGRRWVVSYDDVPEVRTLYKKYRSIRYGISYSAHERYVGREVAFFSHALTVPAVTDPAAVSPTEIPRRLLKRSA
jgi:DNA adenine methylase